MKSVGVLLEWRACQVKLLTCVLSIGWFPDNQISLFQEEQKNSIACNMLQEVKSVEVAGDFTEWEKVKRFAFLWEIILLEIQNNR